MKIAIIGSGIAGNTLAYHLHKDHKITVFEAGSYIGGHTHTHNIVHEKREYAVDTGFIVFNDRTYPNFIHMLEELGVAWRASNMSFSVKCEKSGFEYNGTTLNSLFAQRRNLFRPSFYRMIGNILRFNKESLALLEDGAEIRLGDYLKQGGYSQQFIDYYIIPMGSAIWSTDAKQMLEFPARFFVRFFHHHGMLSVSNRPEWRTIAGGSARYVEALTAGFKDNIRLNTPVAKVRRLKQSVRVTPVGGVEESFDWVFFACHSDQALTMLSDATEAEREILGTIPYQENSVFLHYDQSLLPKRKLAWAAWNYHVTPTPTDRVAVTYNMNILQGLESEQRLLVTLNHTKGINPAKVIKRLTYHHPVYTTAGAAAQARHAEISGTNRTAYAGAYWRNGFHEDGVMSALKALEHFNAATQAKVA
ncbi:NAD(P)/FAD-dependent oxidoreductase [Methyloradius palustris]|uniref:Amine oxidase n=1 Tax=Methyloradius palustris TaxID=2778876 RepID=A0A8D5FZI6_9PROT|nr:FAD-dependent oxidoreductase [Methyloradius palustris]BCM25144.1 amine oxidase [Methyloradius palustris]